MPSEEPEATTERPCPNPYGIDHSKQHCPICKGMEKVTYAATGKTALGATLADPRKRTS